MKALEQKILSEGEVYENGVLKIGSFLNQQLDVPFLFEMGKEINKLFKDSQITRVFTIESSGIAIAVPAAYYLNVPAVFAKKSRSSNVNGEVYTAKVKSFTYGTEFDAVVAKSYIKPGDRVLIIDDFLATGNALRCLISIVEQAGAIVAGCAVAVEKIYQGGGDALRAQGYRVAPLALIEKIENGVITFGNSDEM